MSGPEMARRMRVYRRDLKVLLTSGYSHDILEARNGGPADDVHFLTKPFNIHQVTHKIRKVLDGGGDPPSWQLGDLLPAPADRPGPEGGI